MAKKNLTAYECIYISKYHFSSAEFLLLSSNPFTFFSAGFLYHLSFELLLKGLITLEGKKYARIHSLEKLIKNLNGKKQKDVNKIITKETLYGQHFLYTTGSDLRDKILKLEVVTDKSVSSAVLEHIQLLHNYRYSLGKIGTEDSYFYKAIYNQMYLYIQEEYKDILMQEKIKQDEITTERINKISAITITKEEREEAINQDIEKWKSVQKLYEK